MKGREKHVIDMIRIYKGKFNGANCKAGAVNEKDARCNMSKNKEEVGKHYKE